MAAGGFKVGQGYLEVDVDAAALDKGIASIEAKLAAVKDLSIKAGIDQKAVDAALLEISTKLMALQVKALSIGGINQTELDASIAEIRAKLAGLQTLTGIDLKVSGVSAALADLTAIRVAADAATGTPGTTGGGGTGFWGLTGAALGFGGALTALGAKIPLFGGLLSGVPFVNSVAVWHLLLDAILEVTAEVVPALIALTAFGIAASSTVNDIVHSEQAFLTITTALGTTFPGVTSSLQNFTDSVKPQVYVLFGEALGIINNHASVFTTLATGAGRVMDNLGARIENALGGNGLDGLVGKGVQDLQTLGNIIGNVFGIFGNILHTLPGYAQMLFGALQDVTGALEAITGNSIVQGLLNIGLWFHGAVLWGGLAVTAIMSLQGPLLAVGGWAMNAAGAVALYVSSLIAVAGAEGIAAAASAALEGIMAALGAVNPFVWAAVAIGALVALGVWLSSVKTAAQDAYNSVEQQLNAATTFVQAQTILAQGIKQTNDQLSQTPEYIKVTTSGMHGLTSTVTELNPAWQGLTSNVKAFGDQQQTLTSRMATLDQITGSQTASLSDLNAMGVKAGAIATESAAAFANQVTQIKALTTATEQLAGYQGGQAAAAQNALTNLYMQETVPAIKKITGAETDLMNVITGGQSTFDTFELNMASMTTNLSAAEQATGSTSHTFDGLKSSVSTAGAAIAGTSQASYTLNQAFYGQISAAQNVVSALMSQSISQGDLTKVTATMTEQMLQYAGSNTAARSTMVDLINNALGPGTVSLKTLNQWVGTNATSLSNMNGIIGQSTVKAGGLTDALNASLKSMQAVAIWQAQGGQQAWNTFTTDIEKGTTSNKDFRQAAIDVMTQLTIQANNNLPAAQRAFENYAEQGLGLTKTQADDLWKTYLPGLQNEINSMHGKNLPITVVGSGTGTITFAEQNIKNAATGYLEFHAAGGLIKGGTPGRDSVLGVLMPGELVVPADMVASGSVDHLKGKLPGFATGGLVGPYGVLSGVGQDFMGTAMTQAGQSTEGSSAQKMIADMAAKVAAAAATMNLGSGVTQWAPIVLQALAMLHLASALENKVLFQMQTESGGNPNAINLTDINAQEGDPSRGLMQTIMATFLAYHVPGTSMNIYDPLANVAAALNYAAHVYGPTLQNASGAGIGSGHGYAAGGFLPPGRWGYVGESGTEIASARPGGGVDIRPTAQGSKQPVHQYFQYFGTQYPTTEMKAQQMRDMALALAVAP
jgi:SLT domain-containing protein